MSQNNIKKQQSYFYSNYLDLKCKYDHYIHIIIEIVTFETTI